MQSFMTTREVADRLGVSVSIVCRRVRAGQLDTSEKLPGVTGAYLFDPAYIEAIAPSVKENA